MLKSILAASALAIMATAAVAQAEWSGFYGGANLTWGETDFDAKGIAADDLALLGFGKALAKTDDVTLAVRGGHDWQSGNLVWGVGAEINLGLNDAKFSAGVNDVNATAGVSEKLEFGREKSIFGRVGYASGNFLGYGLAGWTWADGKGTVTDGIDTESYTLDMNGLTLGVGAEYRLSRSLSVYGEYSLTKYDNIDGGAEDLMKVRSDKLSAGVNFRF